MTNDGQPGVALKRIELEVSDPSQLMPLHDRLSRVPGIDVQIVPGQPAPGQLGVWDVLAILASSSGALTVVLKMLPETIRAARTNLTIRIKSDEKEFVMTAANADDVVKLLGGADDG